MTSAQHPPAAASKSKFGLSFKHRAKPTTGPDDEDWYIPYNGPYEPPREPAPRRQKARDSWGDPVEDDDGEEDARRRSLLADKDRHHQHHLRLRYGHGDEEEEEERKGRSRDRTLSMISGHTTSSAAMDPSRPSMAIVRRSTVSTHDPPRPSYVSLSAVGVGNGVGESPVPPSRRQKDANRISIASIFSGLGRRPSASASPSPNARSTTMRSTPTHRRGEDSGSTTGTNGLWRHDKQTGLMLYNASPASSASSHAPNPNPAPNSNFKFTTNPTVAPKPGNSKLAAAREKTSRLAGQGTSNSKNNRNRPQQLRDQATLQPGRHNVHSTTDEEDYYNSYYATLRKDSLHQRSASASNSAESQGSNANSNSISRAYRQRSASASNSAESHNYTRNLQSHSNSKPNSSNSHSQTHSHSNSNSNSDNSHSTSHASSQPVLQHATAHPYAAAAYVFPSNTATTTSITTTPNLATTANTTPNFTTIDTPKTTVGTPKLIGTAKNNAVRLGPSASQALGQLSSANANANASAGPSSYAYNSGPAPPRLTLSPATDAFSGSGPALARALRNSISSPDLRSPARAPENGAQYSTHARPPVTAAVPTFVFPKGKERWLAAETWCDALLFPRPRLKVRQEIVGTAQYATASPSRRIVSPPPTPPLAAGPGSGFDHDSDDEEGEGGARAGKPRRESAIASRVLAYSRSLVDLNGGKGKARAREEAGLGAGYYSPARPRAHTQANTPLVYPRAMERRPAPLDQLPSAQAKIQSGRPPRPKSFAWDDLDLPSPVPSLAHVLREGEELQNQRKKWQRQAQASFANKRSRSISRTRGKSLTQKAHRDGQQRGHQPQQSSLEYIAAQACLGTQNLTPPIAPQRLNLSFGTSSSGGHSHSTSYASHASNATASSSQAKNAAKAHSRNGSWSKSALKIAKSSVCGFPSAAPPSPLEQTKALDLESALKTQGTKVIRLADPVHLPVDRGTPPGVRQTPSPAFSAISESKVGIALGTPPEEAGAGGASYTLPSHPYAQGGLSFSHAPNAPEAWQQDFAGAHPSVVVNGHMNVPAISDILARHKLPPHIALHPYAQPSSARDSYIDANGLIGQHRSGPGTPHASKMWAQFSPGVLQEVLPGDFQYSPFMSDAEDDSPVVAHRNTIVINDTVGLGETLVNATRKFRASQDSGLGTSESHGHAQQNQKKFNMVVQQPGWTHEEREEQEEEEEGEEEERDILPGLGPIGRRTDSRRVELPDTGNDSILSTNNAFVPQQMDYLRVSPADRQHAHSPAATSSNSSPTTSPRPLGSPHDLDSFQDLFYRPSANHSQRTPSEAALPDTPAPPDISSLPWDINIRHHRTGSGLTSLARQLSDEFEQIAMERDRERTNSSQYSQSNSGTHSSRQPSSMLRHPTEGSLQFVFEEMPMSTSPPEHMASSIHAFEPSHTLPEDVSRASSYIENNEDEDDPTVVYRVGMVESVSTPSIVPSEIRRSLVGQTSLAESDDPRAALRSPASHDSRARILSGLQAPTTEATRSSYMTSGSDLSRMSALSDFPAPPRSEHHHLTPKHMSLLSSFFDENLLRSEGSQEPMPGSSSLLDEDRVTFGNNQNADDLVRTLSSTQPGPPF